MTSQKTAAEETRIRSAPEIFQRRMYKLIEGMPHIEVVADDFVVVRYGDTQEQAM